MALQIENFTHDLKNHSDIWRSFAVKTRFGSIAVRRDSLLKDTFFLEKKR